MHALIIQLDEVHRTNPFRNKSCYCYSTPATHDQLLPPPPLFSLPEAFSLFLSHPHPLLIKSHKKAKELPKRPLFLLKHSSTN